MPRQWSVIDARIAAEIKSNGHAVSANTVKYMKRMGLRSKLCCRYKGNYSYKPHSLRICPNHLDRKFTTDTPGKVWVSDIIYIHTKEHFLYLTSIIDLYDGKIIGWSLNDNLIAKDTLSDGYKKQENQSFIQTEMVCNTLLKSSIPKSKEKLYRACHVKEIVGIML